ncbi:hypothetical protein MSSAC_1812 [Methanosarcina siciliae C2J]|uniref:Uncharacterized protein n=1 Tax=Methanosarcina siciliae C2J TaxID=1434118 RepID=A0A0E3PLX1_9EURY|nr:hypothetical protein MSSAC_1812 [Methanosarcina siciliae C2J]
MSAVKWISFIQFGSGLILLIEAWIKVPFVAGTFDFLQLLAVNIGRGIKGQPSIGIHHNREVQVGENLAPVLKLCDFGLEIIAQLGKRQMMQRSQEIGVVAIRQAVMSRGQFSQFYCCAGDGGRGGYDRRSDRTSVMAAKSAQSFGTIGSFSLRDSSAWKMRLMRTPSLATQAMVLGSSMPS